MTAITVLLPTYNRAALLRQALVSLRLQTLSRELWRVVILDNASTDNTPDVIREFTDLQIVYDRNSANQGADANFDRGFRNYLDTEFVSILCDDDFVAPHFLQTTLQGLHQFPDAGLFGCGMLCGRSLLDPINALCGFAVGVGLPLDEESHTVRWTKEEWLVLHSVITPVGFNACLFRSESLRSLRPILPAGVFYGDRWLLARFGRLHPCYTSPWPAAMIRLHGQNGFMAASKKIAVPAHRQVGDLILGLCAEEKIDVKRYWKARFGTINQMPEPLKHGIYLCYPDALRREIIGNWRPCDGVLSRLRVPERIRPFIRKLKNSIA
ncbi:MAG TPA: glycosyltransferase [Gemmataceae bacterium]|nr:glycosyltransferase [Gemmataceae bacterium]